MMFSRTIGDATVSNIIEYSGPTHDPDFLFPDLPPAVIDANASWLAPDHLSERLRKFIVTIQIWVLKFHDKVILIDTGVGNRKTRRAARMNALNTLVPAWLEAAGAGPEEVTHVVHTHLHVDHVGWNTVKDGEKWRPTFPNARYLFPERDYVRLASNYADGKLNPDPAAAFEDSVKPIFDNGLADLIAPDQREVADCLQIEPLPGHTAGMLSYRLQSRGEEGIFSGDVMHSPLQIVAPQYNTRFCEAPEFGAATRQAFMARAADRNALIMPCHFGAPYCGRVRRSVEGFVYLPER
jgi:glyoxylase-like metal-dependent hydrolase (beta-lactamase superfamily II)